LNTIKLPGGGGGSANRKTCPSTPTKTPYAPRLAPAFYAGVFLPGTTLAFSGDILVDNRMGRRYTYDK